MIRKSLLAACAFTVLLLPSVVSAQTTGFFGPGNPIIPEECQCERQPTPSGEGSITTAPDFGCVLQVVQNVINFAITLAVIVMVLYLAYAGFRLMVSRGNPGMYEDAKTRILNAIIGLVVILCAWALVDFVMKAVADEGKLGPWHSIISTNGANRCIVANEPESIIDGSLTLVTAPPGPDGGAQGDFVGDDSTIPGRICAAASQSQGMSSRNAAGTNGGRLACAWAVNQVLSRAGVRPMGGLSVRAMEGALRSGRGMQIQQNSARCGDIVLVTGSRSNHVGICMNAGCTRVISNSSSRASFNWISGPQFPGYASTPYRIYRVRN